MSKISSLPTRSADGSAAAPGIAGVDEILAELRAGRMVLMLDDEDRENEGDLIMAAQCATAEAVAFMIRHTSGIICVSMDPEQLARLELPQMVPNNDEAYRTAFTVSVDYRFGTTTGVSSSDRAATIRALVDPASSAQDFARPGHIFPLRPRRGGVLIRAGHTEAAMDLCMLAGLQPAGVLCELMNDDGSMARRAQIEIFAREHALKIGTIADLIRYRLRNERSVERVSEQMVQTEFGEFRLFTYEDRVQRGVHLALVRGRLDQKVAPLVRVHVADTLRDLLGIRGDARAWTLRAALERVAQCGNGVVVILREPEGPQELNEALRSLAPSPGGAQHNASGGDKPPPSSRAVLRTYGIGAQILKDLGVRRMRVLSAPKQMHGISAFDLEVEGYLGEES
ncbi:MAG TPA: 3,4-dihydroxy-2-butanone-4-phosphate synthase [Steroidobacteraceae bacterium]|jgi:3,4-dihydroxy 2-butanone 4-phosphate synthase/GTP cyclohydrolase II|nr:3,4-dihydroxy-2-butanone-4-phosphate synthase [Steroidobacteraceae bacterium]